MKKLLALILAVALCAVALVSCGGGDNKADDPLTRAKEYLFSKYKNISVTAGDFDLVDSVTIDGVKYDVDWTVDVKSGNPEGVKVVKGEGKVTVDVDEKAVTDIEYTLKGAVKDEAGNTSELALECKVPEFKMLSWEGYLAAAENDAVAVKGIVTGIMAKSLGNTANCLYIQGDGCGFYVYGMASDPAADDGVEVGMTVSVSGVKSLYNGTLEITSATVEILDAGKREVVPVDYTEIYAAASALDDAALAGRQAMLVTLKNVEITGEEAGSGYYKFKLGDKESYIRISSSTCPISKDDQEKFKKDHADHFGWVANATGVICVYNGAFYLTPVSVDAFEYVSLPSKSDEEMLEFEAGSLSLKSDYYSSAEIEVPAVGKSYEQVSIEWSSDNDAVRFENGKMIITLPDTDAAVKVTATLKCGDASKEVAFDIKLVAHELTEAEILEKAFALEAGKSLEGTYSLTGEITEIPTEYSEEFKNVTVNIKVADKTVQCFRLTGEGCENLVVGDVITVTGTLKNYNGTIEFDKGCTFVLGGHNEHGGEVSGDVAAILERAFALADGEALGSAVTLTGEVTAMVTPYNEQFDNVTVNIKVGDKTLQCFRLKGDDAATVGVGDVITVTGDIKNYKGTVEFVENSTFVTVSKGEGEPVLTTEAEILEAAFALEVGTALGNTYSLTGEITEINTEYSEEYGNITVTIKVADKSVMCYRLKGEGAENLAVGDVITVSGKLKNFQGTIEFDSGCTFTK